MCKKTMCPPGYHDNSCVGNHALGHMMYACNIVYHVPKCMSYHKSIVVITGRAHCFHDCIYITPVLLLSDLSTVCRGSLMTTYIIYTHIDRFWGGNNLIQV